MDDKPAQYLSSRESIKSSGRSFMKFPSLPIELALSQKNATGQPEKQLKIERRKTCQKLSRVLIY